jgi:endonuclease/exonuclease/phosphatase family metal-dependent hydrolase
VHTNAYNHKSAAAARRENIRQLCSFIRQKSSGQAVIIMGDLNAHYAFELDNLQELVQETKLKDAWLELCEEDRMPIRSPLLPDDKILNVTNKTESIDKILYRSSDLVSLHIADYQVQNALFSNYKNLPLSDHHPISVVFNWQLSKMPAIDKNLVVAK